MKYIRPSFQIQCRWVEIPYTIVALVDRPDSIDEISKTRAFICVKELPLGTDVETECVAAVKGDQKEHLLCALI